MAEVTEEVPMKEVQINDLTNSQEVHFPCQIMLALNTPPNTVHLLPWLQMPMPKGPAPKLHAASPISTG